MTRRAARRAELYRRLDADCEDARLGEPPAPPHFTTSPPPKPAEAPQEDDDPIWSDLRGFLRKQYWKYRRSLAGMDMESNQGNTLLGPTQDSICPPEKRHKILSDKDVEQCEDGRHSFECQSDTIICKLDEGDGGEDEQGDNLSSDVPSKRSRHKTLPIEAYAAQCARCEKWRLIPEKEKYEEIRAHITKVPFTCEEAREWKPDVTCSDPSDVYHYDNQLWAMDQHDIAQTPPGWERLIKIRREGCTRFADVYYISPSGKTLRSSTEVGRYLKQNPHYEAQGVKLSQFSFKIPAPTQPDYVRKRTQTNRNEG